MSVEKNVMDDLREYIKEDLARCQLLDEEFPELKGSTYKLAKNLWDYFEDCGMMGDIEKALAEKDKKLDAWGIQSEGQRDKITDLEKHMDQRNKIVGSIRRLAEIISGGDVRHVGKDSADIVRLCGNHKEAE